MNPELLLLRDGQAAAEGLAQLVAFRVSGAPVVDAEGVVVGVASWKELVGQSGSVADVMSAPAATVTAETPIEAAAVAVAKSGYHRLVVVDGAGCAIGVVSTLDLVRALVGVPVAHPSTFPHRDSRTSLTWTDARALSPVAAADLPEAPGLLVLYRNAVGVPNRVVWAEATTSLRDRAAAIADDPDTHIPQLRTLFDAGELCFRAAPSPDTSRRLKALRSVLYEARDRRRSARGSPQSLPRK